MKPQTTLRRALEDPALLDLGEPSWVGWRALLLALMGEALTPGELEHFRRLTGRYKPPTARCRQFWGVIGRRGGKSKAMAALGVYLGTMCSYPMLSAGERGTVLLIAQDQRQASIILNYASAVIEHSPILRQQLVRVTADTIELKGSIFIEVRAANFRRLRGLTALAVIADEVAFWIGDESSSNPDVEIINAVKPALLTTRGLLIGISSPYARKGVLWEAYAANFGPEGADDILVAQGSSTDLNPSLPQSEIDLEYEKDPAHAAAEFGAQFRDDIQSFVSQGVIDACTDQGELERPPMAHFGYTAFVDPSGGSSDSMTLAISHIEGAITVVDKVVEIPAPFSPQDAVRDFAKILKSYRCNRVFGDAYASEWVAESFRFHSILYEHSELNRSELYISLLSMLNSKIVALVDNAKLKKQLLGLERRTGRLGRDTIDHGRGAHDDVANAVAGAVVLCNVEPLATSVPGFNKPIKYPDMGII
jgi:hypothetical protein